MNTKKILLSLLIGLMIATTTISAYADSERNFDAYQDKQSAKAERAKLQREENQRQQALQNSVEALQIAQENTKKQEEITKTLKENVKKQEENEIKQKAIEVQLAAAKTLAEEAEKAKQETQERFEKILQEYEKKLEKQEQILGDMANTILLHQYRQDKLYEGFDDILSNNDQDPKIAEFFAKACEFSPDFKAVFESLNGSFKKAKRVSISKINQLEALIPGILAKHPELKDLIDGKSTQLANLPKPNTEQRVELWV